MQLSYLDRLLEPMTDAFTPELADTIINIRVDPATQTRIEKLRRKANAGTMNQDEDEEYKDFVETVDLVSILQVKAKRYLAKHAA